MFSRENHLAHPSLLPYTLPTFRVFVFAIVTIAGFQEKVSEGDTLHVPLLDSEKGAALTFKDVLLIAKGKDDVVIGKPNVAGAYIEATVLDHGRDDKIRVYRMRRRKRFQKTRGHRQDFTMITITKISA